MDKIITSKLLGDPKLFDHFTEHSYYIKELNRNADNFKDFQKQMKIFYKERATDKISSAIDGVEMISSVIDSIK